MNNEKRRGRPRKTPFVSILPPEVIEGLLTPTQKMAAEQREQERLRGIERRAAAKTAQEFGSIETKEALWQFNRSRVPEAELNALLERQEAMFDLTFCMRKYVDGIYEQTTDAEDRVPVAAIAEEVELEVKQHGVVTMEVVLMGDYWKTPLYENFQSKPTSPTSIFARLGVVTAIPSHSLHQWTKFMAAQQPPKAQPGNGYTTLRCACDAMTGRESVPLSIADRYRELGKKFLCSRCRDVENKLRAHSTMHGRSR
jgi:hypothetical protein